MQVCDRSSGTLLDTCRSRAVHLHSDTQHTSLRWGLPLAQSSFRAAVGSGFGLLAPIQAGPGAAGPGAAVPACRWVLLLGPALVESHSVAGSWTGLQCCCLGGSPLHWTAPVDIFISIE